MTFAPALRFSPLALLLMNPACASTQPTAVATSAAASATALPCAPSGQRVESLRSRRGSKGDAEAAIKWTASISPQTWSLGQVIDVEGQCATSIGWFTPGVGALRTGERFAIDEMGTFAPNGRLEPTFNGRQTRGGPLPSVRGAAFVMASRVSGAGNHYVGVWRGATGKSFVAAFSEVSDRVYGPIKILVTSVEPILTVSYFPAPDTPSGQIGLVQQTGPDKVRLIAYYWHHRSFFPVR